MLYHKNPFKQARLSNTTMNKWLKLLIGLILVLTAVYAWGMNFLGFGEAALSLLKGGVVWFVIMLGLLLLFLSITDLKE